MGDQGEVAARFFAEIFVQCANTDGADSAVDADDMLMFGVEAEFEKWGAPPMQFDRGVGKLFFQAVDFVCNIFVSVDSRVTDHADADSGTADKEIFDAVFLMNFPQVAALDIDVVILSHRNDRFGEHISFYS